MAISCHLLRGKYDKEGKLSRYDNMTHDMTPGKELNFVQEDRQACNVYRLTYHNNIYVIRKVLDNDRSKLLVVDGSCQGKKYVLVPQPLQASTQ